MERTIDAPQFILGSRRRLRLLWISALLLLLPGCATHRPVLYPNARYEQVGAPIAESAVAECMQRADTHVGNSSRAGETARSTGTGAAVGSAVGAAVGAVRGRPGHGAAAGAAGGGAGGFMRGIFRSRNNDPVFQRFVERCLNEQGFETIGWR
jgi:uncharacterized protein YcfJ